MKRLLVPLLLLAMTGCTNDNDNNTDVTPEQKEFALTNFSNTGCKSEAKTRSEVGNSEYFELKATDNGGLYVKHVNVYFNCASHIFDAKVSIDGKFIKVTELDITKSDVMTTCICPYDLGYEIGPLEDGVTYSMTVISTYDLGIDDPRITPVSEESTFSFVYSPTLSMVVPASDK